ncbi:helix-turn-helix domain-containing protein [Streptomyces sp. NA02950]|uniref:helix-turn-helix transcriptional regulator n=1 Tax=Streptomyces sp. NA02950 TaxID=2742137 RepID=UPI0015917967|nr:helix-turn-helix transcriptional regulator [Streptomyces sp. NA02950]QKV91560.1 helix-turn-helix domain-containing protein [Streptomyces sp. NA02950]
MPRSELADFLRRCRARLTPADVGLTPGPRRRTPGLRREEVARLAGMSADYCTRLEQGRGPRPSRRMLTALARALRLTDPERDHLFRLAGEEPPHDPATSGHIRPGLLRVLDRLYDTPAQVVTDWGEVLAQNTMAAALFGDLTARPPGDRNLVRSFFTRRTGPGLPETAGEREEREERQDRARNLVADLRAALTARPDDPGPAALVAELRAGSQEFTALWEAGAAAVRRSSIRRFRHPVVGDLELESEVLLSADHAQRLIVYTARPGSTAAERLELLAVVGLQDLAPSG